ncbi:hypothetical protein CDD83_9419 [Cordyceps sp. RAO-2017]|nr:hypothetical protein CDD83_9419 [Cordyceps sp. RAO-2017]
MPATAPATMPPASPSRLNRPNAAGYLFRRRVDDIRIAQAVNLRYEDARPGGNPGSRSQKELESSPPQPPARPRRWKPSRSASSAVHGRPNKPRLAYASAAPLRP